MLRANDEHGGRGGGERRYRCSICEREVIYAGPDVPPLYPFCSQRCRHVDLGKWLTEQYTIDRDLTPDDLPDDVLPPELRG